MLSTKIKGFRVTPIWFTTHIMIVSYITPMQLYLTINGTVFGIHVVEYMLTLGVNVFEFMPIMK